MPTTNVNGIDIDYLIEGDGPETIVLVNGLADEKESWGYQTPDFVAAGHRVLTFDNRGVGNSSMPPGPYTTAATDTGTPPSSRVAASCRRTLSAAAPGPT